MRESTHRVVVVLVLGLLLGIRGRVDASGPLPTRAELEAAPDKAYILAQVKPIGDDSWTLLKGNRQYQNWVDIEQPDAGSKPKTTRIRLACLRSGAGADTAPERAYSCGVTAVLLAAVEPGRYRLKSYETRCYQRKLEVLVGREFEVTAGNIVYLGLFSYELAGTSYVSSSDTWSSTVTTPVTTEILDDVPAVLEALELAEPGLSGAVKHRIVNAGYLATPFLALSSADPELRALWQRHQAGEKLTDEDARKLLVELLVIAAEARKSQRDGETESTGKATESKPTIAGEDGSASRDQSGGGVEKPEPTVPDSATESGFATQSAPGATPSALSSSPPHPLSPRRLESSAASRTTEPPADAGPGDVWVSPQDGAEMVFVPAGGFAATGDQAESSGPRKLAQGGAFWIDRHEVTVERYRRFCEATGRPMPPTPHPGWSWEASHPIVNVSWREAADYAAWAGKRLPTEAEWEMAVRGTDGRVYPWGKNWNPDVLGQQKGPRRRPSPVGSCPVDTSPYGAVDMAGNVQEWCASYGDGLGLPVGSASFQGSVASESGQVARGAWWERRNPDDYRYSHRDLYPAGSTHHWVGFRCARDVATPDAPSPTGRSLGH